MSVNPNTLFNDPIIVGGLRDLIISWIKQFVENYLKNAEFGDVGQLFLKAFKKAAITFLDELGANINALPAGGFNDIIKPVAAVFIEEMKKIVESWDINPSPTPTPPNPNPVPGPFPIPSVVIS